VKKNLCTITLALIVVFVPACRTDTGNSLFDTAGAWFNGEVEDAIFPPPRVNPEDLGNLASAAFQDLVTRSGPLPETFDRPRIVVCEVTLEAGNDNIDIAGSNGQSLKINFQSAIERRVAAEAGYEMRSADWLRQQLAATGQYDTQAIMQPQKNAQITTMLRSGDEPVRYILVSKLRISRFDKGARFIFDAALERIDISSENPGATAVGSGKFEVTGHVSN
jgi:hypothetical protein